MQPHAEPRDVVSRTLAVKYSQKQFAFWLGLEKYVSGDVLA